MHRATAALLFSFAVVTMPLPARALCSGENPIDTCLDKEDIAAASAGEEEAYQRLDGGSYGGRPAETRAGKTITIGDTTVTLSQAEEKDEPWQPFNRSFGDNEDFGAREDKVRGKDGDSNPLSFQCYADGCY